MEKDEQNRENIIKINWMNWVWLELVVGLMYWFDVLVWCVVLLYGCVGLIYEIEIVHDYIDWFDDNMLITIVFHLFLLLLLLMLGECMNSKYFDL